MSEIACVNGAFMPLAEAVVSVEDRGFQFADGVYEVIGTYRGEPHALEPHLQRLERSLRELQIELDVRGGDLDLEALVREGIARAGFEETLVYVQITRGTAARCHEFPSPRPRPTVVMTLKALHRPPADLYRTGVRAITVPDLRWKRCDIKSVALLPNILAKEQARRAGAFEALLVDADGCVTEGSSTSAFCVHGGAVYTTAAGPAILPSITRGELIDLARRLGLPVNETAVTLEEYLAADEVFLAGTTTEAMPVVAIDGTRIGDGRPGPVTGRLREAFYQAM